MKEDCISFCKKVCLFLFSQAVGSLCSLLPSELCLSALLPSIDSCCAMLALSTAETVPAALETMETLLQVTKRILCLFGSCLFFLSLVDGCCLLFSIIDCSVVSIVCCCLFFFALVVVLGYCCFQLLFIGCSSRSLLFIYLVVLSQFLLLLCLFVCLLRPIPVPASKRALWCRSICCRFGSALPRTSSSPNSSWTSSQPSRKVRCAFSCVFFSMCLFVCIVTFVFFTC
jgi:hypothetical protein